MMKLLIPICLLLNACGQESLENSKPGRIAEPIVQGEQLRFPPGHPQLALLSTVTVKQGADNTLELPAKLIWNETKTQRIYPALSGRISQLHAEMGQSVKAGQALATLASPDLDQLQAELAKANADLNLSQKQLTRQQNLLELGIIARKDLEQAEAEQQRSQAELTRANAKVKLYGDSKDLRIKSQLTGVVVERNINPGQDIRPEQFGPQSPALFVISDPTDLWVSIDLPEKNAGNLQVGMPFHLSTPNLPNGQNGKVLSIADQIDPVTRFIKVRGQIANPERSFKSEMLAQARFDLPKDEGVYVPSSAVIFGNNANAVFVQEAPGVFVQRSVVLGKGDNKLMQIKSGLKAGDLVVNDNVLLLARMMNQKKESS